MKKTAAIENLNIVLLFFVLLYVFPTRATTIIKCKTTPDFIKSEFNVYVTNDFITPVRKLIGNGIVNETGFTFEVNNDNVWVLDIEINDYSKQLFVDKNSEYEIVFESKGSSNIKIISEPDNNINYEINSLTKPFDTLAYMKGVSNPKFYTLFLNLYGKFPSSQKKLMKKIVNETSLKEKEIKNDFLKNYFKFFLAPYRAVLINEIYGLDSLISFKKQLFLIPTIPYTNPAFFDCLKFFTERINKYIYTKTTKVQERDFSTKNHLIFSSLFEQGEIKQLAQLEYIAGQLEYYSYTDNSKEVNIFLTYSDSINNNSKYKYVKRIAINLKDKYTSKKPVKQAPDFSLPDRNGKMVSLSDFKGSYVYIDFWAVWCNHCREHHKETSVLKDQFKDNMKFVSISVDKLKKTMTRYLDDHPKYDWTFLWAGEKSKIVKDYNIYAYPTNILINKEGKIIYRTGVGIEKDLENIKKMIE